MAARLGVDQSRVRPRICMLPRPSRLPNPNIRFSPFAEQPMAVIEHAVDTSEREAYPCDVKPSIHRLPRVTTSNRYGNPSIEEHGQ